MANPDNIFPAISQPGIQRDGTDFDSDHYIDGQWCRFYRGKPQKMGGYNKMINWVVDGSLPRTPTNVPRGIFVVPNSPLPHVYIGDQGSLQYFAADKETGLAVGGFVNRTPDPFTSNPYNQWVFDLMFDTNSNESILIAMANQNLYGVEQTTESAVYYGSANSIAPLTETGFYTSGGFVVLPPYLLIFGNYGNVIVTERSDPTTEMNNARVTGTKIIAGRRTRGGGNAPSGLLWSLDSLIKVSNVGTSEVEFSFDTITEGCSILSSQSVIEYNSIIYWVGTDSFYMYNGFVQEWPNTMSLEYFFDNLNFSQRQKVWMTKYKRYGEIWIYYPSGNSQECDSILIYNVNYQTWYDSKNSRGCGIYSQSFGKPILVDNTPKPKVNPADADEYIIWRHEVGTDQVVDNVQTAIDSHFEMSVMSWAANAPGGQNVAKDQTLYLYSLEPDFIQSEDIVLTVNGRKFANSPPTESNPFIFNNDPDSPNFKPRIPIKLKERLMSLSFDSNAIGGNYKMGKCLLVPREGDIRP